MFSGRDKTTIDLAADLAWDAIYKWHVDQGLGIAVTPKMCLTAVIDIFATWSVADRNAFNAAEVLAKVALGRLGYKVVRGTVERCIGHSELWQPQRYGSRAVPDGVEDDGGHGPKRVRYGAKL